jgi:hypothetical protein
MPEAEGMDVNAPVKSRVSVSSYGARGDGVNDEMAAIQAPIERWKLRMKAPCWCRAGRIC